jgi:hypothetical protein
MNAQTITKRLFQSTLLTVAAGWFAASLAADEIHWTIIGPTAVTFDWRGTAAETSIAYGASAGNYTTTVTAANPTGVCVPYSSPGPFYEAKITGLTANTLYHYRIASGPDHTFRTPPPAGTSNFEVLVEGDLGDAAYYPTVAGVQSLVAQERGARFTLLVGDLSYADDHGIQHVDNAFNDVMVWSQDVAEMAAWGNHEWDNPPPQVDDLRNYKGRFDFPNPKTSPGTPAISDCSEDWYWFDYGNVRFIAYPEPWTGAWSDWKTQATTLMDAAQSNANIKWIVTFGHRPVYSSGHQSADSTFQGYMAVLASTHSKYVLNVNGHSHDYERSYPQDGSGDNVHGAINVTVGTGGSSLEEDGTCLWLVCTQPSWSAARFMHLGYLKLYFTATSIQGNFFCGPAGAGTNDITCNPGDVIDSFSIGPPVCDDADGDGYGSPAIAACPHGTVKDCDNGNAAVYPGAPQICDGVNNDCNAPGWPSTAGTNDGDNDGDGLSACAGDCNDANPFCRNDCTDSDGDGACNQFDNCPGVSNPSQTNADGDAFGDACDTCTDTDGDGFGNPGYAANTCPTDCAPSDPHTYPGAPEINDGKDNQCPGDEGYGVADETSGDSGFHGATNTKTDYSWPAQTGATSWQVARASSPDFSVGCSTTPVAGTLWTDTQVPAAGQVFYYLNRPVTPFVGSWGTRSAGVERSGICPGSSSTTLTVGVTASSDDAEETDTGSMRLTSGDIDLTLDGSYQTVGIRFNGWTIPRGSRILNASIQFTVRDATSAPTSVTIQGEADDNPGTFTSATSNISQRPRTSASASWSPPAWNSGEAGVNQRTPSLASVIHEVVSRPGWASGNSIVIIITGTGDRSARSWETDATNHTGVALLTIEFDGGGQ